LARSEKTAVRATSGRPREPCRGRKLNRRDHGECRPRLLLRVRKGPENPRQYTTGGTDKTGARSALTSICRRQKRKGYNSKKSGSNQKNNQSFQGGGAGRVEISLSEAKRLTKQLLREGILTDLILNPGGEEGTVKKLFKQAEKLGITRKAKGQGNGTWPSGSG